MNSPHYERFDPPHEPEGETKYSAADVAGWIAAFFIACTIGFTLGCGLGQFIKRVMLCTD